MLLGVGDVPTATTRELPCWKASKLCCVRAISVVIRRAYAMNSLPIGVSFKPRECLSNRGVPISSSSSFSHLIALIGLYVMYVLCHSNFHYLTQSEDLGGLSVIFRIQFIGGIPKKI